MATKLTAAPVTVSLTGTTARSSALGAGQYMVTCDVDCFILQGGSGVNATTSSNPLWSKGYVRIQVADSGDGYVAGILSTGTGTLYILKVGD